MAYINKYTQALKLFIQRFAPLSIKRLLFNTKRFYKAPFTAGLKKGDIKIKDVPIIIMSLPRSGSSWLGSIIGFSEGVRYLREPVTTSFMLGGKNRVSVFAPETLIDINEYLGYIENALSAIPSSSLKVTPYLSQWRERLTPKPLIIKEVNPLALEIYSDLNCRIVYLTRHPFAIAKSYLSLNWQSEKLFQRKFSPEQMSEILTLKPDLLSLSYTFQLGFLFGWIEAYAQRTLSTDGNFIRYEDICFAPEVQLKQLCNSLSLNFSCEAKEKLQSSLSGKQSPQGKFDLIRDKNSIGKISLENNDLTSYEKLMNGYNTAYTLYNVKTSVSLIPFYQNDESFVISNKE